jgi:hypothetical protein
MRVPHPEASTGRNPRRTRTTAVKARCLEKQAGQRKGLQNHGPPEGRGKWCCALPCPIQF